MDRINGIVFILNTYTQWNQFSHAMLWCVSKSVKESKSKEIFSLFDSSNEKLFFFFFYQGNIPNFQDLSDF